MVNLREVWGLVSSSPFELGKIQKKSDKQLKNQMVPASTITYHWFAPVFNSGSAVLSLLGSPKFSGATFWML